MKLFDVMVYDDKRMQNVVYRAGLVKRDAKNLSKELQQKGFKSHVLTSRANREPANIRIDEPEPDYSHEE
jgi:hypothetical protein